MITRPFSSLGVYDILANLIPGSVLIIAIGATVDVGTSIRLSSSTLTAAVFLVAAFVMGHFIQAIASELDGTPTLFGAIMEELNGSHDRDIPIELTVIEESVWPMMRKKFDLPDEFDNYGHLFRLLLSYLETTPSIRSLRFQSLHSYYRSMWAVWYLVAATVIVVGILDFFRVIRSRSILVLIGILVLARFGIYVFGSRKEKFNQRFVQYVIIDFYNDQINEYGD